MFSEYNKLDKITYCNENIVFNWNKQALLRVFSFLFHFNGYCGLGLN